MHARPAGSDWEFLAVDLAPGELVLEVLNRHRSEGWEYDRIDPAPCQTRNTLYLKRRRPGALAEASCTARGAKPSIFHPHARRWTVADDEVVRGHSAREAARLLEVSIATIYIRRQTLGMGAQKAS
jgi:hypothetical protein